MALGEPKRAHAELVRAIVNAGDTRQIAAEKLGIASRGGLSLLLRGHRGAGRDVAHRAAEAYGIENDWWEVDATASERAEWHEKLNLIPHGRGESAEALPPPEAA